MKAKFEFDLDDPDEKMEHMRCTKALDMAIALWDIHNLKLDDKTAEEIGRIFYENGIFMDDLIY